MKSIIRAAMAVFTFVSVGTAGEKPNVIYILAHDPDLFWDKEFGGTFFNVEAACNVNGVEPKIKKKKSQSAGLSGKQMGTGIYEHKCYHCQE